MANAKPNDPALAASLKSSEEAQPVVDPTELRMAAFNGDWGALQKMIADGADLTAQLSGMPAIHWAVQGGQWRTAQALLPLSGRDPRSWNGLTLLMTAAQSADSDTFDWALSVCDPKAVDNDGETALMAAARERQAEHVRKLLPVSDAKARANMGRTALMLAAAQDSPECIELLLPASDLLQIEQPAAWDEQLATGEEAKGETALLHAARHAEAASIRLLATPEAGRQKNHGGETALMIAIQRRKSIEMIEILAQACDVRSRTHAGRGASAFDEAMVYGTPEIVDALWGRCDPLSQNGEGQTAIESSWGRSGKSTMAADHALGKFSNEDFALQWDRLAEWGRNPKIPRRGEPFTPEAEAMIAAQYPRAAARGRALVEARALREHLGESGHKAPDSGRPTEAAIDGQGAADKKKPATRL